jgi:type II secretory pathway component PulF
MTTFKYTALDCNGKRIVGRLDAQHESDACARLAATGVTPLKIREASRRPTVRANLTGRYKIRSQDIAELTREISVLVEANIPIARGMRSVAEHEKNPALRDMVTDIAVMIESGEKLTTAFGKYESVFGDVYIETMRAAERTGTLASVTEHIANMLERNLEARDQLRRAMTYPAIVGAVVAMAMTVIIVFVVPRFAIIFETNGIPLPLTTRVIRGLGDSVRDWWWLYLLGGAGVAIAAMEQWRSARGRLRIERVLLKTPYFGTIVSAVTTARFSRVMSIGIDSGIEVIEAIGIAGRATGRPVFVAECDQLCDRMRAGESFETVLNTAKYLPNFARRLLAAGKDSKELAGAGRIIARHYDRLGDNLAKSINTVIEPMITISIAIIVLIVALSVFLPMWQMISIN